MENKGGSTDRYNGAFADAYLFFLSDKDTTQECSGKAWEIAQRVNKLPFFIFFHIYHTMFTAHAGVARDDGDIDSVGIFITASDHVIAHYEGKFLFEPESVFDYRNIAAGEIRLLYLFLLPRFGTDNFSP